MVLAAVPPSLWWTLLIVLKTATDPITDEYIDRIAGVTGTKGRLLKALKEEKVKERSDVSDPVARDDSATPSQRHKGSKSTLSTPPLAPSGYNGEISMPSITMGMSKMGFRY